MERIAAFLVAFVTFIAYPALFVAIAAGVSGCSQSGVTTQELVVGLQPIQPQQHHPRRATGDCNLTIAYPVQSGSYDSWMELGVGDQMERGPAFGDIIVRTLTVPCGTTMRWNGSNQYTAANDRWLCMSWMNMTSTPWGPSSVEYWIDDDPLPYLANCQTDPELPFGGGNFIIQL